MFLRAVAKPRQNPATGDWFDGKIGCWPFIETVEARRTSVNRPKGALVTAGVSVDKAAYKGMLIQKLLPAMKTKLEPYVSDKCVVVQHDNAKPHSGAMAYDVTYECHRDGWQIRFEFQPPNSPDTNVLDLGFFRSVQSLQIKERATTIDGIVDATYAAWNKIKHETLWNNFRTYELVLVEILRHDGDNNFKLPHVGKAKLERLGQLPAQWTCPSDVKTAAVARLAAADVAVYKSTMDEEVKSAQELADLCSAFEEAGIVADPDLPLDAFGNFDGRHIEPPLDENCGHPEDESFEIWAL